MTHLRPAAAQQRCLRLRVPSELVSRRQGDRLRERPRANFELYAISRDGTTGTRLTFNDAGDGYPAWAPDGSEIVFGSDRAGVRGGSDLFTMRVDGSEQVNRTLFPGLDIQPDWQPVP